MRSTRHFRADDINHAVTLEMSNSELLGLSEILNQYLESIFKEHAMNNAGSMTNLAYRFKYHCTTLYAAGSESWANHTDTVMFDDYHNS